MDVVRFDSKTVVLRGICYHAAVRFAEVARIAALVDDGVTVSPLSFFAEI